ncbi:MAG TPA: hypothetical protein VGM54_02400 [Chthoniobacter sp.]|jgi:hypothetical protein
MESHHHPSRPGIVVAIIAALVSHFSIASAAAAAPPQISFAVYKTTEESVEGPDVERTFCTVGDNRLVFGVPKGCRLSSGDGLMLLPTEAGLDGEIHVNRSPLTPDIDLATNALKYRDEASRGLPQGATNVVVAQPAMNPYPYNGWKSLGFTWTYASYGRPMVRTVSYINLEVGVQVVVTTLSAQADAAKVQKLAQQFMGSWWVKAQPR